MPARMHDNNDSKLKEIERKIIRTGLLEAPGYFMLALGLYAKLIARGHAFHPALNNPEVIRFLLVVGIMIVAWGSIRIISLIRQKSKLLANGNH